MKLFVIYALLCCHFLSAVQEKEIVTKITIQNQVRQTLDNVMFDYLIPNGLGFDIYTVGWSGYISYSNNAYFIQQSAMDIGLFRETNTILGKVGVFTSVNQIRGIEHYFQDKVLDKESQNVHRKTYHYLMTEFGFVGHEMSVFQMVRFEGSVRLGLITELKGLADKSIYGRTPLKLWFDVGKFQPGISWDYIVHDSMEGWDVDNIKIFIGYIF